MKINKLKIKNYRSGQVAIIVLLVSAVLMTVGLSLSKKSTTETKIDTNEELLKKAFNAAESGIDYYLGTGNTNYSAPDSLSSADVTARNIEAESGILNFGEYTAVNGVEFYWLVNHLDNGEIGSTYYGAATVDVCGTGFTGSMEINYFYKSGGSYGVKRYGYNFSSNTNYQVNGFASGTDSCATVSIINSPILVTVTPIFNGGRFYIEGTGTFPIQGVEISSTGKSGGVSTEVSASQVQVNKKLKVLRRYKVPYFMLSGVVSETSVLSD